MNWDRLGFSRSMVVLGSGILGLGVLLLLIKLVIFLAWFAAGIIAGVGLVMFLIGMLTSPK
jgi:hypothetical protein